MSSRDSLVDIPAEEFSSLRDKFKVDWPKHICAFSLFNTLARRFENNSESGKLIKVLSLNEDWSDGTFIAMVPGRISLNFSSAKIKFFSLSEMFHLEPWIHILIA